MNIRSVKIKEGYIMRELGGEFCLFHEGDSENGSLLGLPSVNEICIFLWNRLEQGATPNGLVKALSEKNNIDEEDAQLEVEEFLAKMIHGNVVEIEY